MENRPRKNAGGEGAAAKGRKRKVPFCSFTRQNVCMELTDVQTKPPRKAGRLFLKKIMPILCQGELNWGVPGNLGEAVRRYVCLSPSPPLLLSFSPSSSLLPLSLFLSVVLCLLVFPVRRKEVRLPSSPDQSTRRILLRGSLLPSAFASSWHRLFPCVLQREGRGEIPFCPLAFKDFCKLFPCPSMCSGPG